MTDTGSARVEGGASCGTPGASLPGAPDELDLGRTVEQLLAAIRHLRGQLEQYDDVLVAGLEKVQAGASVSDTLQMVPPSSARRGTEVAISDLFEARRQLRRAVIYATLQDGMSVDDIAATLEVSVHVVCALAAETPFRSDCPGGDGAAGTACRASGSGPCTC